MRAQTLLTRPRALMERGAVDALSYRASAVDPVVDELCAWRRERCAMRRLIIRCEARKCMFYRQMHHSRAHQSLLFFERKVSYKIVLAVLFEPADPWSTRGMPIKMHSHARHPARVRTRHHRNQLGTITTLTAAVLSALH